LPGVSERHQKRPADKIRALNALCAKALGDDPQVTVVDTWTLFANEQGDAKIEEFPDLLHPNAAGYTKWEAALRPILATLGFLENEPDTFTPEPGFESLFEAGT
jgi:lysophospholipase L1-like esterase